MSELGYGPRAYIDGPPPVPAKYGLLQAAAVAGSGVRVVPDADANGNERWGNGVEVWPFPPGIGVVTNPNPCGTDSTDKGLGDDNPANPTFYPFTVSKTIRCTAASIPDQAAFKARAVAVMGAVEGPTVEKEILTGAVVPVNPHLSDGTGVFPLGDSVTSALNGLAELEGAIARSGRAGLIHMSPQLVTMLSANYTVFDVGGLLKTVKGTTVIAGDGYVDGATPSDGHPDAIGWEEWIYATGPIEIRRSETITLPDTLAEALDRGNGATNARPNEILYIVERYYVVDYDDVLHAAVLVDRCQSDCGSAPS